MKDRTIEWVKAKILKVLAKNRSVWSYLKLSALVLENVRSLEEQHHLDIAIEELLVERTIRRWKENGGTNFALSESDVNE